MATKTPGKQECLNPRSGRSMLIDKDIYDLFSKAITQVLAAEGQLSFTDLTEKLRKHFLRTKTKFERSLDWYAVTIKNDMEARGKIKTFTEKGKKFNSLSK